jgi:multiple sugar transport system ATP-binding protein
VKARDGTQLDLEMLGEKIPMPVPTDVVQVLNKKRRGKVRIGFRPSDVNIVPDGTKSAYHGVVYSFEPLGAKSILTVQAVDGTRIRALVDGHLKFEMDRRVQFAIEPHSTLTFDADTQEFLARSELPAEEVIHG